MKILCIDSERTFVKSLEDAGHNVYSEELGYKSGSAHIVTHPNEADAIFFNLEKPACFDRLKWGTLNTTFKAHIESLPSDALFKRGDEMIPQYQLITYNQINTLRSPFVKNDIVKAVEVNGRSLFVFLNASYMKHVYQVPNFFNIKVGYSRTETNTYKIFSGIASLLPSLFKDELSIKMPIRFKIELEFNIKYPNHIDAISNDVRGIFSILFLHGKGLVWLLPEFIKNDAVALYLLQNLDKIKKFVLEIMN